MFLEDKKTMFDQNILIMNIEQNNIFNYNHNEAYVILDVRKCNYFINKSMIYIFFRLII